MTKKKMILIAAAAVLILACTVCGILWAFRSEGEEPTVDTPETTPFESSGTTMPSSQEDPTEVTTEPTTFADPIDPTENTDPTEPTEPTEPTQLSVATPIKQFQFRKSPSLHA